jgi:hypothetical protein
MIAIYGSYVLSFAISGSAGGGNAPAFLTDSSAMNDGRSGLLTSIKFTGGAQTTASYVDIDVTILEAPDAVPALGGIGLVNVDGLPLGTLIEFITSTGGSVEQRLAYGPRNELCAWTLPLDEGDGFTIRIHNNVNGSASIVAGTVFGIGEVIPGRALYLPVLANQTPSIGVIDPTTTATTAGGNDWALMRKSQRKKSMTLGRFATEDITGGPDFSRIKSGSNPPANIDIIHLAEVWAESSVMAVCEFHSKGRGDGTLLPIGGRWNQDFAQHDFLLCRPSTLSDISLNTNPLGSWQVAFQEAR